MAIEDAVRKDFIFVVVEGVALLSDFVIMRKGE